MEASRIVSEVKGIDMVYFHEGDVVRHPLVQRIVRAYDAYESEKPAPTSAPDGIPGPDPASEPDSK